MPRSRTFSVASRIASLAGLVALAGCLSTPPSTLVKLARLSPLESDPAQMRIAVRAPSSIRVRTGDIRLAMRFDGPSPETSLIAETQPLIEEQAGPVPGIADDRADGTRLHVAELSPEDAQRIAAVQRRIKQLRADGVEGRGSLSVTATGCAQSPVPDGPVLITTYLQTAVQEDFVILNRRVDLRTALISEGADLAQIPPCTP